MKFVKAKIEDAKRCNYLIRNSIQTNAKNTQKELSAILKNNSVTCLKQKFLEKERNSYLLLDKEFLIGYVAFKDNEVLSLYVAKRFQNKGFGRKILFFIEKKIRKKGFRNVKLESSLSARDFYEKQGYKVLSNSTHKTPFGNIRCFLMKKSFSQ
ncbi:MAG: GNAT family N-acetyltransferase [Nanoarchaeota archaeon]|nr:GNAT family N-acetyltransferase [Nanoarchaeota archaeon]MBU1030708.1 GNAT family N-acetyltransferase [Nanoarchaeota archaeon]MBU1849557.1 GNAT family N-acetyltransferase [Nanoarchaeota archaeon]